MVRWIESIVVSILLSVVAILIINNYDELSYALFGANDPMDNKPNITADEIEQAVHKRVNIERVNAGLVALSWDPKLSSIALLHSRDMGENGFFDHINLENESPTERGLEQGYNCTKYFDTFSTSGIAENIHQNNLYTDYKYRGNTIISYNWSSADEIAKKTVDDWMKSPDHRKNILDPNFDSEGIGVFITNDFKVYITENFC
jgi:uncharacterized protein YkwD